MTVLVVTPNGVHATEVAMTAPLIRHSGTFSPHRGEKAYEGEVLRETRTYAERMCVEPRMVLGETVAYRPFSPLTRGEGAEGRMRGMALAAPKRYS